MSRSSSANGGQGQHWIRDTTRERIYERDGHRCVYCGVERGPRFTLDHLTPRSLGGSNHASNLVSACHKCNSDRQHLSLRAWFKKLRSRGVDTKKLGAKIRRLIRRPLSRQVSFGEWLGSAFGAQPLIESPAAALDHALQKIDALQKSAS